MLFSGLKAHGHGSVKYFEWTWAWVGQVGLFLTNIGPQILQLGIKIKVKVLGDGFLEEITYDKVINAFEGEFQPKMQFKEN